MTGYRKFLGEIIADVKSQNLGYVKTASKGLISATIYIYMYNFFFLLIFDHFY